MIEMEKKEVSSFLSVPSEAIVRVDVEGTVYDLGFVHQIHATSEDYIVWEDKDARIWYETSNRELIKSEDFHKFWNRYQLTRCRSTHNLDEKSKDSYLNMQSSAIASALEGQFMAAAEALESANAFITTANERVSRGRYTGGAVVAFLAFIVTSGALASFSSDQESMFFLVHVSLLGGSLGAILSALAGGKVGLGFDPNASQIEGVLNGALRVLYGVISAFVVVVVIKSGVVSTPLITPESQQLSLTVIAIIGGFAERWAADLIQRFSSDADPNREKPKVEK